jgi:hypothetical protein
MNATQHVATRNLGAELERARLERRARRMTFAVGSLRQRANERERERGATPRHLQHIIVDFEAQIDAMNVRLRELARDHACDRTHPAMEQLR